ncbi:hypothetical protein [Granulicella tundricola]|uniref:Uncharacterized protein n=1 Tax=Granulicella tundricola (strain ATCC BAA-1859 / DSM 23138 / MP5ACTX9) TaxID=1198114 RepID=E8X102_GRATM|nr:hypothetical protein [Granulicella tundricola]ADW67868.1 hypothetical protein AciX9_0800 [Granulicella tundricola MP5ACTX9]
MESQSPFDSRRIKLGLAHDAYKTDTVRIVERDLSGLTHLVSSRQGLWAVNHQECRLIAHGLFFGITITNQTIYLFESCDLPRSPLAMGRLAALTLAHDRIVDVKILAKGLDNGCHQIDFIDGKLQVLDTYNQRILSFATEGEQWTPEEIHPLDRKPTRGWKDDDPSYVHANSLLAVGDRTLLLLHNGGKHLGRNSEIAVFDKQWRELERWPLRGSGCHGLALLEDGTVLTCGSLEGTLLSPDDRIHVHVSPHMTRGLSVGKDSIVVGASRLVEREGRMTNSGTITFMDREFKVAAVLDVPAAPTEVRRLDGQDAGLSPYLATQPWGSKTNAPSIS